MKPDPVLLGNNLSAQAGHKQPVNMCYQIDRDKDILFYQTLPLEQLLSYVALID